MMPESSTIHGFSGWVSFLKATIWLGTSVAALVYVALTFALDDRYAPASLIEQVASNGVANEALKASVAKVGEQVESVKITLLQDQLFSVRMQSCNAETGDSRAFFLHRLQELAAQYRAMTGAPAEMPDCTDLR